MPVFTEFSLCFWAPAGGEEKGKKTSRQDQMTSLGEESSGRGLFTRKASLFGDLKTPSPGGFRGGEMLEMNRQSTETF